MHDSSESQMQMRNHFKNDFILNRLKNNNTNQQ